MIDPFRAIQSDEPVRIARLCLRMNRIVVLLLLFFCSLFLGIFIMNRCFLYRKNYMLRLIVVWLFMAISPSCTSVENAGQQGLCEIEKVCGYKGQCLSILPANQIARVSGM